MILQKEITSVATLKNVVKSTIDKDWALGHFLDAIFTIQDIRERLIFKGGTCLRKCYLPDYRFSEDLDFTSNDKGFRLTGSHLNEIAGLLNQRAGMLTHIESLKGLFIKISWLDLRLLLSFGVQTIPGMKHHLRRNVGKRKSK